MDIPVPAGHIEETDGKVLEWSRRKRVRTFDLLVPNHCKEVKKINLKR
jgi:hypothetical protein